MAPHAPGTAQHLDVPRELRPSGRHLGFGAFDLVRASAYRECSGYHALRLTIVDDVKLGMLLGRAWRRTRVFVGGDDALCEWGTTVSGMFSPMEKHYFAAADYRLGLVLIGVFTTTVLFTAAALGPWRGTAGGIAAGVAPWTLAVAASMLARRRGWSVAIALLVPLLYPLLFYAVLRSALVTVRQGGVRWRDTFYPLDVLRKGNVR
jgi:hypothetical protein